MHLEPGQRRQPKQLRSRLMVEAIVEAARQVFSDVGFEAASTNHIAERAGVSIGSLYQYFPNKDTLILEVQRAHHEEVLEAMKSAMDYAGSLPLKDAIRTIVSANLDIHLRTPKLHASFEEWIPAETKLVDRSGFLEDLADAVANFLDKRPDLNMGDQLQPAVFILMNMVRSIMHASVRDEQASSRRDQIVDHLAESILGCLSPYRVGTVPASGN